MKNIFIIISFLIFSHSAWSQWPKAWGVEGNIHYGKIFKHNPKIEFDVLNPSWGAELGFKFQTHGKDKWSQYQRYPAMGISAMYFNFGDKNVLGNAYAVYPNLTINILRTKKGFIEFQFGSGIAFLNRPFNINSNPTNNAIGSKTNNITAFRFDGGYRIKPGLKLHAGIGLTHFSNGGAQKPNLGINVVSGVLGIQYSPNPVPQEEYIFDEAFLNVPKKRWGFQMHFDLAYREFGESGGARFPVYIGSAGGVFHFNAVNRMHFGLEAEYNVGVFHYIDHLYSDMEEKELRKESSRLMFYLADELMFGNFGVYLQVGFYIHQGDQVPLFLYNKLSVRYYLPPVGKPKTRFFAAVYLKNHLAVAEYIAFGMGAHL